MNDNAAKRLARLAAVQALYQGTYEQQPLAEIVRDSIDRNFESLRDESDNGEAIKGMPDAALFSAIVEGVTAHQTDLDDMIVGALDAKLTINRLETLLRVILRAGAFELHHHGQIPTGVIINDYVDVTCAFFNGKEPGLVNGVLDKLAGKLRAD
jgi:N utilization substance protein B